MSVTPQDLPSIGTTQYSNYLWKWRNSTATHEIYDLEQTPGNWAASNTNIYTIQVGTDASATDYNMWSDHGSSNPMPITINGVSHSAVEENSDGTVSLYGNSGGTDMLLYKFTKPTTASWISSGGSGGGGTTTEGTGDPVPVGSKYFNNLDQLVFVVGSSSPTSDADIVYKIFRGQDRYNMTQVFVLSHTNGSDTEYNVGDPSSFKRWELRLESNDVQYDSQILVDYSAGKVSCNFW